MTASAGGDIIATDTISWIAGGSFTAGGDVELTSAATILGSKVEGKEVKLTATTGMAGDTAIGGVDVTARDSAELTANAGDISNSRIFARNAAALNLAGDLNNNTVTADIIAIKGLGVGGKIANVENGSYVAKADALTVDASGKIEGATFTAELAGVTLTADGDIADTTVTAATNAVLTATAGSVLGSNVTAASATLTGAQRLSGNTVDVTGTATLSGADLLNNTVAAGTITANAAAIKSIIGGTYTSSGAAALRADDGISSVTVRADGAASLTTTGAAADIANSTIEGATVNLTSGRDISNSVVLAENAATITLAGDLNNDTVTAGSIAITGLVNVENGSYVAKADALTVDASGKIEARPSPPGPRTSASRPTAASPTRRSRRDGRRA